MVRILPDIVNRTGAQPSYARCSRQNGCYERSLLVMFDEAEQNKKKKRSFCACVDGRAQWTTRVRRQVGCGFHSQSYRYIAPLRRSGPARPRAESETRHDLIDRGPRGLLNTNWRAARREGQGGSGRGPGCGYDAGWDGRTDGRWASTATSSDGLMVNVIGR